MKNYEIIIQHKEDEKPILPAIEGVGYKPYPKFTYQPPNTEKVFEAETSDRYALNLARHIRAIKEVTRVDLYGNGELIKKFD